MARARHWRAQALEGLSYTAKRLSRACRLAAQHIHCHGLIEMLASRYVDGLVDEFARNVALARARASPVTTQASLGQQALA